MLSVNLRNKNIEENIIYSIIDNTNTENPIKTDFYIKPFDGAKIMSVDVELKSGDILYAKLYSVELLKLIAQNNSKTDLSWRMFLDVLKIYY